MNATSIRAAGGLLLGRVRVLMGLAVTAGFVHFLRQKIASLIISIIDVPVIIKDFGCQLVQIIVEIIHPFSALRRFVYRTSIVAEEIFLEKLLRKIRSSPEKNQSKRQKSN